MNPKDQLYRAAEYMTLPSEVLGASQIEITGTRQILLCGHKGIRTYTETEIIVDLTDCAVIVSGSNLGIRSMTRDELMLSGELSGITLIR